MKPHSSIGLTAVSKEVFGFTMFHYFAVFPYSYSVDRLYDLDTTNNCTDS